MIAEAARAMMILAMHVIGDRTADADEFGARRYRQKPAAIKPFSSTKDAQDIGQGYARFDLDHAGFAVEGDEAIEPAHIDQAVTAVKA